MNDTLEETATEAAEAAAMTRLRRIRARRALHDAPELAAWIRNNIIHADGRTERGFLPSSSTPLSTIRTDDADELYVALTDWVTHWSRWLDFQLTTGQARTWARIDATSRARDPQTEILGFRAGETATSAYYLVNAQALWLLRRDDQIVLHPEAAWYQDAIVELVWRLRAQYALTPARERGVIGARCPECGEFAVHAAWNGAGVLDVTVACEVCGTITNSPRPSVIERAARASIPRDLLSLACDEGRHTGEDGCNSALCECICHLTEPVAVGHGANTTVKNDGTVPPLPASTAPANPRVCRICWLIHPEGACQG